MRREFDVHVNPKIFKKNKEEIREEIDHEMLVRMVPNGTVLKNVFMEIHDGNTTFGRQIGSYPLLIGIPYPLELGRCYDIVVTDWGMRSITGIEKEFNINKATMTQITGLPGIGKKRAAKLILAKPLTPEKLKEAIDDDNVFETLSPYITY